MSDAWIQVGIARCLINPPLSAPHAGWGAQTHLYPDGIESDLWATVLVISDRAETVVLVEVDLVILARDEAERIRDAIARALSIEPGNIRVAVSHNHAGPPPSSWNWMPDGREALQTYYQALPSQVSGVAMAAKLHQRPARLGVTWGESHVAVNRRETAPDGRTVTGVNFDGPIDPAVLVARFDDLDGEPIAALVGYTMHPTVMGPTNRLVSPDWPGHLKRSFEQVTGATCMFLQGATGDVGPGPDGYTDDVRVVRRLGAAVGSEAARCYLELPVPAREYRHERIWESGAPLGKWTSEENPTPKPTVAAATTSIPLPVRPQPSIDDATQVARSAEAKLNDLVARDAPANEIEEATFNVKRANMTLTRASTFGGRESFPVELHAVRIGPLVILGCEGEPFSGIAKEIRGGSPFEHTWFGGYNGGWFGYIPTPAEYERGGYEVDTSPYTPEAAEQLVSGAIKFLNEFKKSTG